MESLSSKRILTIGVHPRELDYSKFPDLDLAGLTARAEAGHAAIRAAGFDTVRCQIGTSPEQAEAQIREVMLGRSFGLVMIAAGLRLNLDYVLLLERVVNLVSELAPGVRFCFNRSPEDTIDTLRRWVNPEPSAQ